MFPLLHQLQRLLLSAPKWCSPSRLLQYLLALCRVVFRRCKLKRSVHNLNHEFPLPMTSTIVERKESLSGESMANAIAAGHATSSSYSPVQPQGSVSAAVEAGSVQNHDNFPSIYRCKPPLQQGLHCLWTKSPSLVSMIFLFDHPGFIQRSLAATQVKDESGRVYTDVEKWHKFSCMYADYLNNITLLGTVFLTTNVGFLAIQSVDTAPGGLSSLPQLWSYLSLLTALVSIAMGSIVRSPRQFTSYSRLYFETMKLILGFPFKLFVYSVMFFCLAILSRCIQYGAVIQLVFAGISGVLVFCWLISYWLITEPRNDIDPSHQQQQAICEAAPSAHGSPCQLPPPEPC